MSDINWTEDPNDAAAAQNCIAVSPKSNELFIDIDSEDAFAEFINRYNEMIKEGMIPNMSYEINPSRSGLPHRHITVKLFLSNGKPYKVNEWQRIALQFVLGSDRMREVFSIYRILSGVPQPTRFFEPLDQMDQV